jgi:4'-phosphopantetheinyl transferase EntD
MTGALETLFRSASFIAEAVPEEADDDLYPEEREYVRSAVPKRRAEFGTARSCARRGLAAMGFPPVVLPPGEDGAPRWPPGVVGSITHTSGYCAVVLARDPPVHSVGLDVETLRQLEPGVADLILTPREHQWVRDQRDQPHCHQADLVLLFFSAKEAYYKCQYPVTRRSLDFIDVELDVLPDLGRFVARVTKSDWPPSVARLEGKFAFEGGRVLCGVELLG